MNLQEKLFDTQLLKEAQHVVTQLHNQRSQYEPTWQDLSKYIFPYRGRFNEEQHTRDGERRDNYLINPYPMNAVSRCAAGLHSGLTSPSRPWFELSLQDNEKAQYHPVRMWLDEVHDIMMAIYARSNTYAMLYHIEHEMSQFGTAANLMLQDYNTAIYHIPFTCGTYCGGVDARGRVTTFARRFSMTARQLVAEFGIDAVSQSVRNAYYQQNYTTMFDVEMLITKNDNYNPEKLELGNFPWRAVYYEKGTNERFLRISGYHEQPFLMPRWHVVAGEVYGTGPGHMALGDCMQLQRLERNKLRSTDNVSDPAMMFPASAKKVSTLPGSKNFLPDGTQMQAYPLIPPNAKPYEGIMMLVQEKEGSIGSAFYNDLMAMLTSQNHPQMTAREIAERHEEKLLLLGPVLEQFHGEVLEPMTKRSFGICLRNGLFPPMPEEITEDELKVNFVSLLAQAQKMAAMPAVEETLGLVGNLAAVYPDVLDNINADEAIRLAANIKGTPEKILRSEDEVEELRKQRAEAQQQQMQAQQMAAMAQPAKDMAQAARLMSETPTNGAGNALADILGGIV